MMMARMSYSALILAAAAALAIAGCGKEDITDIQDNWVKKEGEVITKVTDVQKQNNDLHTKFETVRTANITDSAKMADRAVAETMLSDHDSQIGAIEKTIDELRAKRDSTAANAKRADYEAAWKAAETEYDGLLAKIKTLDDQNGDIMSKINGLTGTSVGAMIDTAASKANAIGDSAKALVSGSDKKPAEDAKIDETKKEEKKTAETDKTKKKNEPASSK
jgi:hypothetical protein